MRICTFMSLNPALQTDLVLLNAGIMGTPSRSTRAMEDWRTVSIT